MSEPKSIKQIMLEMACKREQSSNSFETMPSAADIARSKMAANAAEPTGKLLRSCPFIQAELIKQGKISLDDLTDTEIDNLVEHSFLEDWIDNQDVMQSLHISLRTLQTLRTNGTLPYTKVNGKIYYLRKDVEALLRKNYGRKGGCK